MVIIMSAWAKLFLLFYVVNLIVGKNEDVPCKSVGSALNVEFNCIGLTSTLSRSIKDAPKNSTLIKIVDSTITVIPRFSFSEFSGTLRKLDLKRCGIKTIELDGFSDLYQLEILILRENKLTRITGESFTNLYKLRYLDISFNEISSIDSKFYQPQRFPSLQRFYFDYNDLETIDYSLFTVFGNLNEIKFGKNPWKWGYRLLLTQQVENSRIDYRDDWEEWGWMYNTAQECQANGKYQIPSDGILDCVVTKLLRTDVTVENPMRRTSTNIVCFSQAIAIIDCYLRSSSPGEAIRRSLEGLTATLTETGLSSGNF